MRQKGAYLCYESLGINIHVFSSQFKHVYYSLVFLNVLLSVSDTFLEDVV